VSLYAGFEAFMVSKCTKMFFGDNHIMVDLITNIL